MSLSKKRILTNASFKSQFNCSLMCYTHENNNKIIRHRERYLKILRNDKQSSFNALLGPINCDILPGTYRNMSDLNSFKVAGDH